MMSNLPDLEGVLGVSFDDQSLLEQALRHRSFLNENSESGLVSNERLEFLGDAVLGFVIGRRFYIDWPDSSEGELTRLRAAVVRKETLARAAESLRLGDYLC